MKTRQITLLAFLSLQLSIFSQQTEGKIWVRIPNSSDVPVMSNHSWKSSNPSIQELVQNQNITYVEQALPFSRKNNLREVYEITCQCDENDLLKAASQTKGLVMPEIAPKYELLSNPNDYNAVFATDYALDLINAQNAWNYSTGSDSTLIGISDGNYFMNHEELVNKTVNLTPNNTSQEYYHGTAVATTAAGNTNNLLGKSSIGYNCKLAVAAMNYNELLNLCYSGARVINVSWTSGCFPSNFVQSVIDEIYFNGVIVVAAAGNGGTCNAPSALVYPAACERVIAVSSVGPWDNHQRIIGDPTTTHQHNSSVDICAPGYDVALTAAPGMYLTGNGTSFAAPYVTGTIGLMLSIRPCLTYEEVLYALTVTAKNIDAENPSYINQLGAGRLNAGAALAFITEYSCDEISEPVDPQPGVLIGGGKVVVKSPWTANDGNSASRTMATDTNTNQEIKLYPNPSNGTSKLMWNQAGVDAIEIYSAGGEQMRRQVLTEDVYSTELNVDLPGVYFVKLYADTEIIWVEKLIVF